MTAPSRPASWELPPHILAVSERPRSWEYVAVRVTGVLLSVLVLGHFAVTHLVNDVARDDSGFVVRRLSSTLWIAWDSTMLAAAITHGVVGVQIALREYASSRRSRAVGRMLGVAAVVVFAVGVTAIARSAHV